MQRSLAGNSLRWYKFHLKLSRFFDKVTIQETEVRFWRDTLVEVITGLEVIRKQNFTPVKGRAIGLVVNPGSLDSRLASTIAIFLNMVMLVIVVYLVFKISSLNSKISISIYKLL